MDFAAIAARLQGRAAQVALRMPLSWINVATGGNPVSVDGFTLDQRVQWMLQVFERSGRPPLRSLPLPDARRSYERFVAELSAPLSPFDQPEIGEIVNRTIPGPEGRLPVRLYRPAGLGASRVPAILFLHGGSWTVGSLDAYDNPLRHLAARSGCLVASLDYRLAPEHKFPAGLDDAVAGWRWLAEAADSLGADRTRLAIAGDSAGGNLATVVARLVRTDAVRPFLQLLIYPVTDLAMDTASYRSCGEGFVLTRAGMEWARDNYLADPASIDDPRVSPLRAGDLAGSPTALIYAAGFDPLRDEAIAYADKLRGSGVKVVQRTFESLIHGFFGMRGAAPAAARAIDDIVAGLRHELASPG